MLAADAPGIRNSIPLLLSIRNVDTAPTGGILRGGKTGGSAVLRGFAPPAAAWLASAARSRYPYSKSNKSARPGFFVRLAFFARLRPYGGGHKALL